VRVSVLTTGGTTVAWSVTVRVSALTVGRRTIVWSATVRVSGSVLTTGGSTIVLSATVRVSVLTTGGSTDAWSATTNTSEGVEGHVSSQGRSEKNPSSVLFQTSSHPRTRGPTLLIFLNISCA
jgi:hypothetical protein